MSREYRRCAAVELLRRHVCRRAGDALRPGDPRAPASPKSVMRTSPAPVDHHVRGLQVAMQHAAFVRRASPAQSCRAISIALSRGRRPMRRSSDARSSPSTYSIERNCWPSDLADVVDAADVGMRDLARDAHFVAEPRRGVGIACERLAAGTSARPAGRASGRRRDRPRPSRRARASRRCDNGREDGARHKVSRRAIRRGRQWPGRRTCRRR